LEDGAIYYINEKRIKASFRRFKNSEISTKEIKNNNIIRINNRKFSRLGLGAIDL